MTDKRKDKMEWGDNSTQFWKDAQRPMTDDEIKRRLGRRIPGTMEYVLPEEFMKNGFEDYETLRRKINTGRGSKVTCEYTDHL